MAKYRKKPVVIDAVQFNGTNFDTIEAELGLHVSDEVLKHQAPFEIGTLEGSMRVDLGDWVIKGVKGEFYPCKPDIFAATYVEV